MNYMHMCTAECNEFSFVFLTEKDKEIQLNKKIYYTMIEKLLAIHIETQQMALLARSRVHTVAALKMSACLFGLVKMDTA